MSCGYQGYEFGARYLDSICIDGRLLDADDCDDAGGLYDRGGDIPCPVCRPLEAMDRDADERVELLDCRWPRYYAWHLVMDKRRNRGMRTMPFVLWILRRAWSELTSFDRDWSFRITRWFR